MTLANLVDQNGGSLTASGHYSYRVDVCYKNAQGEEIRSHSLLTPTITLGGAGANKKVQLTIPTCLTRRDSSYFLIFRNVDNGTAWYLINSRDPNSTLFLKNDLTAAFVQFVDDGVATPPDATLSINEPHPAALDSYLQPFAAPACEIITAGRDRVWLAGGELMSAQISPSRLFNPGEAPAFNQYLNLQVDRGATDITAIGFVGEVAALFKKNATYILDSDGPDNNSQGVWNSPRLAISDLGAQSQESLGLISSGLMFQSPAGFRLLSPGGALAPIGVPVDQIAREFVCMGTLIADADQEIRFYGPSNVIVYNYLYDYWSTWTCVANGVIRNVDTDRAILIRGNGFFWVEDSDSSIFLDDQAPYQHRIRLPWLHAGNLGDFQRVRRIKGLGRYDGSNHSIHLELFYDERPFYEETFDWNMPDSSSNQTTWGQDDFGSGAFGDTKTVFDGVMFGLPEPLGQYYPIKDNTWEWDRDPARQKCSVFSLAISDNYTSGPGFVLTAICLRLAKKEGLNKTPERDGSSTARY
jgi:hypothetical protein